MRSVCIIPARGGSKGIPGKNLAQVGGKPMLWWSVHRALETEAFSGEVYVTSDSPDILEKVQAWGAKGIERPKELASDTASSEDAVLHAMDHIESISGRAIDLVAFLQPTSPLRKPHDIAQALQTFMVNRADSLFSAHPLQDHFIWEKADDTYRSQNFDYKRRKRRQDVETTYLENGSIYIFKPNLLRENHNRLGGRILVYPMDRLHSFQVDDPEDLKLVDMLARSLYT